MQTKFYLGAAAAALVLAGAGFEVREARKNDGAPFVNPLSFVKSICGDRADGLAKRRAYFVRMAKAYATETTAAPAPLDAPAQIGDIAYKISTTNEIAQAQFNRGVAEMWNFNHGEAVKRFKAAQEADPGCAMCYWGEAFARGPNINAPMEDDDVAPAFSAVTKAVALRDGASEKEKALINALAYRYEKAPLKDRSKLDNAFADAMDKVALDYPNDDFIAATAAEANMDTQAWDYWEADGRTPKGRTSRTLSLIESVLARNPTHVPSIHLYIHVTEHTFDPHRATKFADRLAEQTPGLGHLVHMPSHTYYVIGRFKESIASNVAAVAADEAFIEANDASLFYEYGYYVHNVHFVAMSALMAGDADVALEMAQKLDDKLPADMAVAVPFAQPIKAAPYYVMAQLGDPAAVLALNDPGAEVPFLQAIWRFARGQAYAKTAEPEKAREEAAEISRIIAEADLQPLESNNIPALDILNIARLTVLGRAAAAEGDFGTAIEAMTEAVAIQDNIFYTEPPYWYYPAKQTLAAMVLQSGDGERAEQLFIEALAESPNNGWVLYGLSQTYGAQGDKNGAKFANALFKDAWAGDAKAIKLEAL